MSPPALVLDNVGAEEGAAARSPGGEGRARTVARLFREMFVPPAAFEWLALSEGVAVAWLNTPEAAREAETHGCHLRGAPPDVVRAVHDKAFCHRVAEETGLVPPPLRGLITVFDPDELARPREALRRIEGRVGAWPAWTGGRFTLKPRVGTSARGRFGAEVDSLEEKALLGALPRLRAQGGAILEPWLERRGDASVQLLLGDEPGVVLLGTLTQVSAPSGVVEGHRGTVDRRGRVRSLARFDEELREAALAVAHAAREAGYRGPCGIDAFAFAGPGGETLLRPAVELNARFTLGTVVLAAVRGALPSVRRQLRLGAGEQLPFFFGLGSPPAGWPARPEPDVLLVPRWDAAEELRPALLVARETGPIERLFTATPV